MIKQIGRYEILSEIGRGGFGTVYKAWDPVVCRDVAIKLLNSVSDPVVLGRFWTEAVITGKLKHKNIVTLFDYGEHESVPYLVMELLDGRSLREAIRTGPSLTILEKVALMRGSAEGLSHAHQIGLIHRDIKPANIMLLADGAVKVLDFGIARPVDRKEKGYTKSGMIVGTPGYLAPELGNEEATPASDIFSFGVLCYELLSGILPDTDPMRVKAPEPLRTLVPECPEELESIIQKAMAMRRSERYQSLEDLLLELPPIEAGLRKDRADEMAAETRRALESGDLDAAEQNVRRALRLDPTHSPCRELWRRIKGHRERPALEERFKSAVQEVEALLQRKSFDEAIQALEAMRAWLGSEWVTDLRANLEGRISAARDAGEKAHIAALLAEAQAAAARRDLEEASRHVAQVTWHKCHRSIRATPVCCSAGSL